MNDDSVGSGEQTLRAAAQKAAQDVRIRTEPCGHHGWPLSSERRTTCCPKAQRWKC